MRSCRYILLQQRRPNHKLFHGLNCRSRWRQEEKTNFSNIYYATLLSHSWFVLLALNELDIWKFVLKNSFPDLHFFYWTLIFLKEYFLVLYVKGKSNKYFACESFKHIKGPHFSRMTSFFSHANIANEIDSESYLSTVFSKKRNNFLHFKVTAICWIESWQVHNYMCTRDYFS